MSAAQYVKRATPTSGPASTKILTTSRSHPVQRRRNRRDVKVAGPGKAHVQARGGKATIIAFSELRSKTILDNCLNCHGKRPKSIEIRRSEHTAERCCVYELSLDSSIEDQVGHQLTGQRCRVVQTVWLVAQRDAGGRAGGLGVQRLARSDQAEEKSERQDDPHDSNQGSRRSSRAARNVRQY